MRQMMTRYVGRPPVPVKTVASRTAGLPIEVYACPNCTLEIGDEPASRFMDLLQCPRCKYFVEPSHVGLIDMADGIWRIETKEVPWQAVHELFLDAREDYSAFNVLGPLDDWKSGRLRLYAAVRDGTLVGFSTWNEHARNYELPVLRNLWVRPDARHANRGKDLIAVEGTKHSKFGVESPNAACIGCLESLGYLDNPAKEVVIVG